MCLYVSDSYCLCLFRSVSLCLCLSVAGRCFSLVIINQVSGKSGRDKTVCETVIISQSPPPYASRSLKRFPLFNGCRQLFHAVTQPSRRFPLHPPYPTSPLYPTSLSASTSNFHN